MINKSTTYKFTKSLFSHLLIFFVIAIFLLSTKEAKAGFTYGTERLRSCDDSSGKPSGLDWNPTTGGKDVEFVMSNPVCATIAITSYAAVKIAIAAMNKVCLNPSSIRIAPSIFMDIADVAKCTRKVAGNPSCGTAVGVAVASLGTALAEFSTIYGIASKAYKDTKICGSDWYGPNVAERSITASLYKNEVKLAMNRFIENTNDNERAKLLSLETKEYREWYYGGMEVEDDVSDDWGNMADGDSGELSLAGDACRDVLVAPKRDNYNDYPVQKYYLKGLESGNYNCQRYKHRQYRGDPIDGSFMDGKRTEQLDRAYQCCKNRSRNYICLQNGSDKVFCKAGSKCSIKGVIYESKFVDNYRLICAQSYSLCPYNFSIAGGTQYCERYYDGKWSDSLKRYVMITPEQIKAGSGCDAFSEIRNNDCTIKNLAGRCKNYCQYLTHCVTVSDAESNYDSSITSPYFSDACFNFVGDSQNIAHYSGGMVFGSERHFSAPIVQCTKETLENLFHNKAGHTRCAINNEYPAIDGACQSGQYIIQKGKTVSGESFFSALQLKLKSAVKMLLVLSIMFYGANILMGKNDIREKKDILIYLVKIGMVMYFAVGNAWQTKFFDGVYGSSAALSQMVFKIRSDEDPRKQDGCQFGMITRANGSEISSGRLYPAGKEYLAMWDTLDCKIARYLGFGPSASVANVAKLIFAGIFTGAVGLYFSLSVLFLGLFFLALTIRMIHIFLSSVISIILMVFVSPIVIPMVLFKRTENIFKGWLTNLISFCFQPMILFAYIAIVILVVDKALIGSATFYGEAPFRAISCKSICLSADGSVVPNKNGEAPACDAKGEKIVDPMVDSVACLVNIDSFGKFPGFELIGISIPILVDVFSSHVKEKILTLLKGALVMYLLYKVADQIPEITSALIGGALLPSANSSATAMFKKIGGVARGIQKRGGRAMTKHGRSAIGGASGVANAASGQGKSTDSPDEDGGNSQAGGGGGRDSGV